MTRALPAAGAGRKADSSSLFPPKPKSLEALITTAVQTNTWFILVVHDVFDDSGVYENTYGDGYSIRSTNLEALLAFIKSSGTAAVSFEAALKAANVSGEMDGFAC